MGLKSEIPNAELMVIPMEQEARTVFYMEHLGEIKKYSAVFAVSDYYAMDFIQFLKSVGISVPEDISVVGFDNVRECESFHISVINHKRDMHLFPQFFIILFAIANQHHALHIPHGSKFGDFIPFICNFKQRNFPACSISFAKAFTDAEIK